MTKNKDLSRLVQRAARGEPDAIEDLAREVNTELRALAGALLRNDRHGRSLQATDVVDEAWLRLQARFGQDADWSGRRAFFGSAAQAMRRLLVDHAREKESQKRGGKWKRIELNLSVHGLGPKSLSAAQTLELEQALSELSRVDERAAKVVELHIYCGLSQPQVAKVLGVSRATVELDWRAARTWLRSRLERSRSVGD